MFGSAIGLASLGAGMSLASNTLGNVGNYYFGGRSESRSNERTENMTSRQRREQFKFDLASKNYDYQLAQQAYNYSNSEAYRLAEQYAQNSASWYVEGLKRAGLNPILAATDGNFRGTFGAVGSFSPSSGGSSGVNFSSAGSKFHGINNSIDLAEVLRDVSSARQSAIATDIASDTKDSVVERAKNEAAKSNIDVESAKASVNKIAADTAYTLAEAKRSEAMARQLDSNTALNLVRTDNERANKGVNSPYAFAQRMADTLLKAWNNYRTSEHNATRAIMEEFNDNHSYVPLRLNDGKRDSDDKPVRRRVLIFR